MALITTTYTFGWFGVSGEECTALDLREMFGTYEMIDNVKTYTGPYNPGTEEWEAINSLRFSSFSQGAGGIWSLPTEFEAFDRSGVPTREFIFFDKLECGRMYMIKNPKQIEIEIPHLVPTAIDVDMGRVVPA